jgi:hypothetical protein
MKDIKKLSKNIFKVVEEDLRDRRGIRHEWDNVDEDIQKEIRDTNSKNIERVLKNHFKKKVKQHEKAV